MVKEKDFLSDNPRLEQDSYIELFSTVLQANSAKYVAVPLTTGNRFFHWFQRTGSTLQLKPEEYAFRHKKEVVDENVKAARIFVEHLRGDSNCPVVEPTSFNPSNWTQSDFHYFWGEVISRFIMATHLLDGWQYSNGCAHEFLVSKIKDIPTFSQSGREISLNDGILKIQEAIQIMAQTTNCTLFLSNVVEQLTTFSDQMKSARCPKNGITMQ